MLLRSWSKNIRHVLSWQQNIFVEDVFVRSERRTTVAVLRLKTGLSAEEFGQLIEKSLSTVKSIESGKLALSVRTAATIAQKTGISLRWLLDGDVSAPMIDDSGEPWTVETYEKARVKPGWSVDEPRVSLQDTANRLRALLTDHYQHSDPETFAIVWYRINSFLDKMEKIPTGSKPKRKTKK
jgi:transcriptional regulator with XRE-family HTH domain